MTEKFQISKKLNDGTILVVGGDSVTEFADNLQGIVGDEGRDAVRSLFYDLIPVSGGAPAQASQPQQTYQQPVNQAPAGAAPICPNHQQPAKFVPGGIAKATGRPYDGFYACAVSQQGDRSCRIPR